ncbi:hypothetical protein ACSSS7_004734 [Eimeria intestinalis]
MEEELPPPGAPLAVSAQGTPTAAGGPPKQSCCPLAEEEEAPLPVFASGDPILEQRLMRLFGALRLPQGRVTPVEASLQAAATASAEGSPAARMAGATAACCSPATPPPAAAAAGSVSAETSSACGAEFRAAAEGEAEVPGSTGADREEASSAGHPAGSPTQNPTQRFEEDSNRPAAATAAAATSAAAAAAAEGEQQDEQRRVLSRGISAMRAESPGAWSEATDSTGCTDSSDTVRPPAFGSWRHYSLADVPDEAMGLRAMQRACQAMLQQQRQRSAAAAAAAAAGSGGRESSSNGAAASAVALPDDMLDDPRVCVGPRRRN